MYEIWVCPKWGIPRNGNLNGVCTVRCSLWFHIWVQSLSWLLMLVLFFLSCLMRWPVILTGEHRVEIQNGIHVEVRKKHQQATYINLHQHQHKCLLPKTSFATFLHQEHAQKGYWVEGPRGSRPGDWPRIGEFYKTTMYFVGKTW